MLMSVIKNDPFGGTKSPGGSSSPAPAEVNAFHERSDVDSRTNAQHHTLGTKRNQATSGDHIHDGINSRLLGDGQGLVLTGAKGGNVALTNLIAMLANVLEFTDSTT
jgi:hypothetical protein